MTSLPQKLVQLCAAFGVPERFSAEAAALLAAILFFLLLFAVHFALKLLFVPATHAISRRTGATWDDAFCEAHFPARLAHVAAALVGLKFFGEFFDAGGALFGIFRAGTGVYFALAVGGALFSVISALTLIFTREERLRGAPIKGFFQALKVLVALAVAIWILSILSDKSPAYFLSALGALMAVLLIVFKDTLLGFTAGILISTNDLVRTGDWIEIAGTDVDGEVLDVSLTTVKVRNWDKTIASVPAYTLVSTAFKNWRGMSESGGRRIKRAINIDIQSIRFATDAELERWQKIELLKPYLRERLADVRASNARVPADAGASSPANIRILTNIGTFRAYCVAYLRANPRIHQEMTLIVRQLSPSANGLPLEIYAFANDTRWAFYEEIQSDIFDRLLAILPEFGLRAFQDPSGRNLDRFSDAVAAQKGVPAGAPEAASANVPAAVRAALAESVSERVPAAE